MKKAFFLLVLIAILTNLFSQNYTDSGGKDISLAMLPPSAQGLTTADNYLPNMIQGALIANFVKYSAISVVDRLKLETVLRETESGIYANETDYARLGEVANVDCVLTGTITKTQTGYNLQLQVIETKQARTKASFSGQFTLAEIESTVAIHKATLTLLPQLEVNLTENAKNELTKTEPATSIAAQRALAQGLVAKTEVEALNYYFQAAAFDPSLLEAVNRSSTLQTNISTGNIGADLRNELAWARQWLQRLTELEDFINNMNNTGATPFTLYYSHDIKRGKLDIQSGTVTLSIETTMVADISRVSSISNVIKTVCDGLNATKKKDDWNLNNWPNTPVTKKNPFVRQNKKFNIVFELVNDKNKALGKQTLTSDVFWEINTSGSFNITSSPVSDKTISFTNVNVDDITDNLSIRIASVNGVNPETTARNGVLYIVSGDFNIIGGTGPAGGIIFYDKGSFSDGWRYLEVAPADEPTKVQWGAYSKTVARTQVGIGTGKANTDIIVAFLSSTGNVETSKAAQLCANKTLNGFSDWFLPSKDELNQMYLNLHKKGLGGFKDEWYWSSSQYDYNYTIAWHQSFNLGYQYYNYFKNSTSRVRAVRAF